MRHRGRSAPRWVGLLVGSGLVMLLSSLGHSETVAGASGDPVIAAAGDIACDPASTSYNGGAGTPKACREQATSDLLVNGGFAAVLDLGDNQYECGSLTAYDTSYNPSWGRLKSITHPAPGNHEYQTSGGTGCNSSNAGAAGYFQYFGAAAGPPGNGYYSFDIGNWHIIALNSQCGKVGCGPSSPQGVWLKNDLALHPTGCKLAFWHIPVFSSGATSSGAKAFWTLLYAAHADLVLNGHYHAYERFDLQSPSGTADSNGIREIIVGTGGEDHAGLGPKPPNTQVLNNTAFGVLELTLHPTSYDWKFMPVPGASFSDSGTTACHT